MKITGIVIHGDGYGRKLGYPTANIALEAPLSGVFSGTVMYQGRKYAAAIFATRKRLILEVHLLDFDGDLYGEELVVDVEGKLREAAEFDDEQKLRVAIAADVQKVRLYTLERGDVN